MKLTDILISGLTIAFLVIGVDQSISFGFSQSYWAFMIALAFFFAFVLRRRRPEAPPEKPVSKPREKTKAGRRR